MREVVTSAKIPQGGVRYVRQGARIVLLLATSLGPVAANWNPVWPTEQVRPPRPSFLQQPIPDDPEQIDCAYAARQIELLEKLNRVDRDHLVEQDSVVVPERWDLDEVHYSPLPWESEHLNAVPKLLVVYQPGQVFGAYEYGFLVRWGPVSTGAKDSPTPTGLFSLNWRALQTRSTVNRDWLLNFYFNFLNRRGHSFHEYELPGMPVSHGCVRLLRRDAQWIYEWGDSWRLGDRPWIVEASGTPVLVTQQYAYGDPAPWREPGYRIERLWEEADELDSLLTRYKADEQDSPAAAD